MPHFSTGAGRTHRGPRSHMWSFLSQNPTPLHCVIGKKGKKYRTQAYWEYKNRTFFPPHNHINYQRKKQYVTKIQSSGRFFLFFVVLFLPLTHSSPTAPSQGAPGCSLNAVPGVTLELKRTGGPGPSGSWLSTSRPCPIPGGPAAA